MKVFVTGGTGYLGAALIEGLLSAGHQVTALSRRPPAVAHPKLEWCAGDLVADAPPDAILGQHRTVLHAAACVRTWSRDPREFDATNVAAHDRLLGRCLRLGVPRVIVTSSFLSLGPSSGGPPLTEAERRSRTRFLTDYERTKYLADEVTDRWAARGLGVTTLIPTVLFGPGRETAGNLVGKMLYRIARGALPGLPGTGRQVWSLAYLPDVVRGHVSALERALPGERYILGGENVALGSWVARACTFLGQPPVTRRIPVAVAEAMGTLAEIGARFTGRAPDLTRGVAGVYRHDYAYSSEKAVRALGYEITPFEGALESTVDWVRTLSRWGE